MSSTLSITCATSCNPHDARSPARPPRRSRSPLRSAHCPLFDAPPWVPLTPELHRRRRCCSIRSAPRAPRAQQLRIRASVVTGAVTRHSPPPPGSPVLAAAELTGPTIRRDDQRRIRRSPVQLVGRTHTEASAISLVQISLRLVDVHRRRSAARNASSPIPGARQQHRGWPRCAPPASRCRRRRSVPTPLAPVRSSAPECCRTRRRSCGTPKRLRGQRQDQDRRVRRIDLAIRRVATADSPAAGCAPH